ncbi:MAG: hypothetical protein LBK43_02790 [Treponema sp.]|nr:hypothetical protein [Treponema sp.]
MSQYDPLWKHLKMDGSPLVTLSFEEIKDIVGFDIGNSFLLHKKEAYRCGYHVDKISMKKRYIAFSKMGWLLQPMSDASGWNRIYMWHG